MGASVAGLLLHTPPKWLSLGSSAFSASQTLARGQPLKQFVVRVVHNDPVCPGVDVLKAGQCYPGDASGTLDHSVKGFLELQSPYDAVMLPGSTDLYCGGVEGFLQPPSGGCQ